MSCSKQLYSPVGRFIMSCSNFSALLHIKHPADGLWFVQKRQQQAKQAPHQTRLSVLPTHTRLRHHLSLSPPAAPVKPSFHVGKKGRKPPVTLQVRLIHASIHASIHSSLDLSWGHLFSPRVKYVSLGSSLSRPAGQHAAPCMQSCLSWLPCHACLQHEVLLLATVQGSKPTGHGCTDMLHWRSMPMLIHMAKHKSCLPTCAHVTCLTEGHKPDPSEVTFQSQQVFQRIRGVQCADHCTGDMQEGT